MSVARLRFLSRTGLAWLVWLALLLPVAQAAAACHVYSHTVGTTPARDDGSAAVHGSHCDLCLVAAAAGGPALLGEPPAFVAQPAGTDLQVPAEVTPLPKPRTFAYRSRAPPSPTH